MKKILLLMALCLTVSATMFAQKMDKVSKINRGDRFVERIGSALSQEGHPLTSDQKDKLVRYMSDEEKYAQEMKKEGGEDYDNRKKMLIEKRQKAMSSILSPEQLRIVEANQLNKPRASKSKTKGGKMTKVVPKDDRPTRPTGGVKPEKGNHKGHDHKTGKHHSKEGKMNKDGVKVRPGKGGMKGNKRGADALTRVSSVLSDAGVPLDRSQLDRLKPIYDSQAESMQSARQQHRDNNAFKAAAKKIRANTLSQVKTILTSKQAKVLKKSMKRKKKSK